MASKAPYEARYLTFPIIGDFLPGYGLTVILRGNNPKDRMSALGQKRTLHHVRPMSALPPKADIRLSAITSVARRQSSGKGDLKFELDQTSTHVLMKFYVRKVGS